MNYATITIAMVIVELPHLKARKNTQKTLPNLLWGLEPIYKALKKDLEGKKATVTQSCYDGNRISNRRLFVKYYLSSRNLKRYRKIILCPFYLFSTPRSLHDGRKVILLVPCISCLSILKLLAGYRLRGKTLSFPQANPHYPIHP